MNKFKRKGYFPRLRTIGLHAIFFSFQFNTSFLFIIIRESNPRHFTVHNESIPIEPFSAALKLDIQITLYEFVTVPGNKKKKNV